MDLAPAIEAFIKEAVQDWGIDHKVSPKFVYEDAGDPFTTGYVLRNKRIYYYIRNILQNFKETKGCKFEYNDELRFTTYHEAGHIRQRDLGLLTKKLRKLDIEKDPVERFIYFTYSEFTTEYSTVKLLYLKGKTQTINTHFDFLRHRAGKLSKGMWWKMFQEYYPYFYSYRRLGQEGYMECRAIYEDLLKMAKKNMGDDLPGLLKALNELFDKIYLKEKDTCYYVEWNGNLNKALRMAGKELNQIANTFTA
jgi:hypothetical protein